MPESTRLIPLHEESDIVVARAYARELAASVGFEMLEQVQIATAVSELARNVIQYAGEGEIVVSIASAGRRTGIEVICRDSGPGIADAEAALARGRSTSGGLGRGLSGAQKLFDEFELKTAPGQGTAVTGRKWLP
jgi:serine/threonine-protein kinase RsbT